MTCITCQSKLIGRTDKKFCSTECRNEHHNKQRSMWTKQGIPRQSEASLQTECVKWFRLQYPKKVIFAIPNGGSRNPIEAANMKRQGVLAGVSDLFIMSAGTIDTNGGVSNSSIYVPNHQTFHGLFIEMKAGKNKLTASQVEFILKAEGSGYMTAVCRSFEEFKRVIELYLKFGAETGQG